MKSVAVRRAGEVTRYHTHQCIKPQNVATHTWNVMRIYCERYGSPRPEIWYYILYHDVGELFTGDVPFVAKRIIPGLKPILDKAEKAALIQLEIDMPEITDLERMQVKISELVEMKEYAEAEMEMGNSSMFEIVSNINKALENIANG